MVRELKNLSPLKPDSVYTLTDSRLLHEADEGTEEFILGESADHKKRFVFQNNGNVNCFGYQVAGTDGFKFVFGVTEGNHPEQPESVFSKPIVELIGLEKAGSIYFPRVYEYYITGEMTSPTSCAQAFEEDELLKMNLPEAGDLPDSIDTLETIKLFAKQIATGDFSHNPVLVPANLSKVA